MRSKLTSSLTWGVGIATLAMLLMVCVWWRADSRVVIGTYGALILTVTCAAYTVSSVDLRGVRARIRRIRRRGYIPSEYIRAATAEARK